MKLNQIMTYIMTAGALASMIVAKGKFTILTAVLLFMAWVFSRLKG